MDGEGDGSCSPGGDGLGAGQPEVRRGVPRALRPGPAGPAALIQVERPRHGGGRCPRRRLPLPGPLQTDLGSLGTCLPLPPPKNPLYSGFTERQFTCHAIHPFKMSIPWFSVYLQSGAITHVEHFHHCKNSIAHTPSVPCLPCPNLLSVSMDFPILGVS